MIGRAGAPSAGSLAQLAAVLLAAFYLPPLLIYFGLIPSAYRFVVLVAVAGALALVAWLRGTPAVDLGLRSDNLRPALAVNAPLAIGLVWGALYRRYPNLWGVILSHAVLGLISILVGVI